MIFGAGPLPLPNHPQGILAGWLGRGRGPVPISKKRAGPVYERQNTGENSTSTVKISSRPTSMVNDKSHFAASWRGW